jgi:hypothetical protein
LGSHPGTQEKTFTETRIGWEDRKTRKDKLLNMTVQGRVMKETVTEDGNKLGWKL